MRQAYRTSLVIGKFDLMKRTREVADVQAEIYNMKGGGWRNRNVMIAQPSISEIDFCNSGRILLEIVQK